MATQVQITVGRRKESVARVRLVPGTGNVTINGRTMDEYFGRETSKMILIEPLKLVDQLGKVDVFVTANGGGLSGQAGAIRHGISRALCELNAEYRPVLKKAGFLTRDARAVERKKYGRPGARKRFQFSQALAARRQSPVGSGRLPSHGEAGRSPLPGGRPTPRIGPAPDRVLRSPCDGAQRDPADRAARRRERHPPQGRPAAHVPGGRRR